MQQIKSTRKKTELDRCKRKSSEKKCSTFQSDTVFLLIFPFIFTKKKISRSLIISQMKRIPYVQYEKVMTIVDMTYPNVEYANQI